MTFADQVISDLPVFFNTDEHAGSHLLGALAIIAVVTTDTRQPVNPGEPWDGLSAARLKVYVPTADITRPAIGSITTLDGEAVHVIDTTEADGVLTITLERIISPPVTYTATITHYTADDGEDGPTAGAIESDIPCRFTWEKHTAVSGSVQVEALAKISFAADSGLDSLAIGDKLIVVAAGSSGYSPYPGNWRVVAIRDDRIVSGELLQRVASVVQ